MQNRHVVVSTQAGFSLIEIIIVLGILGTLIAVLVGSLGSGSESAKKKEAGIKAGQLTQQLLRFQADMGKMPTTAEGLGALTTNPGSPKWTGPYVQSEEDAKDPWGNPFEYELTAKGPKITSGGPDGQMGSEDDLAFVGGRAVEGTSAAAPANGGQ